jgi:dihydrofolate reductase
MRKLKLEVQLSVDGFIADTSGNTDWMIWNWGPNWTWDKELQQYHTELTKSVDTILISRQMAEEGFNAHWKQVIENRDDPRFEFAEHITNSHKIVFSKSLDKSVSIPGGWHSTDIANENFVSVIDLLKKRKGKDMIVYGGASFVSSLIKADLIDEFHLLVNPVLLGSGLSIFHLIERRPLELIRSKAFDCGVVLLQYKPEATN